jgi:oligopeptide transport system ATP-binding protein
VLYLGRIVETAPRDKLYGMPRHPYTVSLLSAVPVPNPEVERQRKRVELHGEISSGTAVPTGCRFHPRCFRARLMAARQDVASTSQTGEALPQMCVSQDPDLTRSGGDDAHAVACHFPLDPGEVKEMTGVLAP